MKENFFKKLHSVIWFGIALVGFAMVIKMMCPDPDMYFIAEAGKYIVENGVVPKINPFVIHENFSTIIQQWLFDVLIYQIYGNFGTIGIFIYSYIMLLITLFVTYKFLSLYSDNKNAKLLILTFSGLISAMFCTSRPTSISFLMILLTVIVMEKYRSTKNNKLLFFLPLLSLIEINMHAAMWPMLFVIMVPYIFPDSFPEKGRVVEFIKTIFSKHKNVLLSMVGMFLVGFLNPNGIKGMTYFFLSYSSASEQNMIKELQPPTIISFFGMFVIIGIVTLVIYICKFKKEVDFAKIYMAMGTLLLASQHLRNIWFLIIGVSPIILELTKDFRIKKKKEYKIHEYVFLDVFYIILISFFGYFIISSIEFNTADQIFVPQKAVEYLDEYEKEDIKLFTGFNSGAYMEWNGYKVYMDARPELYQKKVNGQEDVYTEYLKLRNGVIDFEEFLDKYNFTHMIVEKGTLFDSYLTYGQDEYEKVIDSVEYALYENESFKN